MMLRDRLLKRYTGEDSAFWVARVQEEVWKSVTKKTRKDVHPECDAAQWTRAITKDISDRVEALEDYGGDGNILVAYLCAIVFATWGYRISHAKMYDPNRPLSIRRKGLKRHINLCLALVEAIFDESRDAEYFPQDFNPPYGPSAKGGKFV
jgi:hypothetical protein